MSDREQEEPETPPTPSAPAPRSEAPADPLEVVEPENPIPAVAMAGLPALLREAASRAGWSELTHVQALAIPYVLAGRDMMIQSRTGSGKTGAFVLPILEKINPNLAQCQALVLVPTRELAQQVALESERLAQGSGVRTLCIYGGTGYGPQLAALREGAHLVVGTPGRILDHLLRGTLKLHDVKILIFDEADRMLSMGFYPDMREVAKYLPRRRSGFMFSATYPLSVQRLAGQFLTNPGTLSLSHGAIYVAETEHVYYEVSAMEKDRALVRIIEIENPESAIIFCNTKMRVNYVATVLKRFGYDADQLTADLAQPVRDKVMERVRRHTLRFLVATDIAGRGIDINALSHVINYEIPEEHESYIHRTGRTGRAGASGEAISLVDYAERSDFTRITKRFEIDMEKRPLPSDEDVQAIVGERLTAMLEARLRTRDRLQVERMQRFVPMARALGESEDGLALLAMILDDHYQELMHAKPAVPGEQALPAPVREREAPRSSLGSGSGEGGGAPRPRRRSGGSGRRS